MSSSAKSRKKAAAAARTTADDTASAENELMPVMLVGQSRTLIEMADGEPLDLVENYFDLGGLNVLCQTFSLHPFPEGHPNFGHIEMRLRGAVIFSQRPDRYN